MRFWKDFDEVLSEHELAVSVSKSLQKEDHSRKALYFAYLYPRVDANVSKGINHLLKSPFVIHPKTGKVCVPFDPDHVEDLDVNNVPTLTSVINDLNHAPQDQENQDPLQDRQIASMEPYKMVFNKFLKKVQAESLKRNKSKQGGLDF